MATGSLTQAALLEQLSALADGEIDAAAAAVACACWRGDANVRASWHAYHLIGDVLRSEDLARDPSCDAAFLGGLRSRLADEPVILAPPQLAPRGPAESRSAALLARRGLRGWPWMVSTAAAAGFVAVAGVYTLTRSLDISAPPAASVALADASRPDALAAAGSRPAPLPVANGRIIRDARLDAYLAAHKQFAGSSALGPSAFLRAATLDASGR